MPYLPNRCGGYVKIQLGPCTRRGGRHGCPACLSACLGALSTACSLLAQALPPSGTKGSPHSGMPIAAPPAGLPLRTCTGCSTAQISSRFVFLVTTLTAVCRDKAEFS